MLIPDVMMDEPVSSILIWLLSLFIWILMEPEKAIIYTTSLYQFTHRFHVQALLHNDLCAKL